MTTTTTTPKPTPAPRAQRSARPGPPAPKLLWSNGDIWLNEDKPMTGRQAINHIHRHWKGCVARIVETGELEILHQSGRRHVLTGTLPMPKDPHGAVNDFETVLLDFPLGIGQGDLLIAALRAAVDGTDPTPALLQLLATTVVHP
jgi:hypothetical protein